MTRPILIVLLGLFVAEIYLVFAPEPILLIWPDSISYLGPAADAIESGHLTNWNTASGGFVYPLMVWGMLRIAPEPWAIILVQRLVTIATFACLMLAFWWLRRAANEHDAANEHQTSPIGPALMAVWLLTFMLYPPVTGLGQSLMPEVLFAFILTLVLLGLIAIASSLPRAWRTAATWLTPFLSVTLAFVKPHWLFGAVLVPFLTIFLAARQERPKVIRQVLISLGLAVALIVVPEAMWQESEGARFSRVFGPRSLFCNSADLIHRYLRPRTWDPLAQEVDQALSPLFTEEARAQARVVDWHLLEFDGDKCTHGAAAQTIERHFQGQLGAEVRYYLTTYAKAALAEPTYLPKRLGRQLGALARRPFNGVQAAVFLSSRYFPALEQSRDRRPLFARWYSQYQSLFFKVIVLPTSNWQPPLRVFFAAAGLLLSAGCAVSLVWLATVWRRGRRAFSGIERAFVAVFTCALALNALIALVHTFDLPRYSAMQTPLFALLGYAASLTLYTSVMLRRKTRALATTDA
jgi:hypothetical protein